MLLHYPSHVWLAPVAFNLLLLFKITKLSMLRYIILLSKRKVLRHSYLETSFLMPLIRDYTYLNLKMTNLNLETLFCLRVIYIYNVQKQPKAHVAYSFMRTKKSSCGFSSHSKQTHKLQNLINCLEHMRISLGQKNCGNLKICTDKNTCQ